MSAITDKASRDAHLRKQIADAWHTYEQHALRAQSLLDFDGCNCECECAGECTCGPCTCPQISDARSEANTHAILAQAASTMANTLALVLTQA